MNYFDILEKLGVDVLDDRKVEKFFNNIRNIILTYENEYIPIEEAFEICQQIGIIFTANANNAFHGYIRAEDFILDILFPVVHHGYKSRNPVNLIEFLGRISIIFQASFFVEKNALKCVVKSALNDCGLPFELCDNIIIPKGVGELDESLVCNVAQWLQKYPSARKTYMTVLQQYFDNDEPRDIADNLRKTFETFLQEFLGNSKNMDNNIGEIGAYLKDNGINEDIRNMFTALIKHYKLLNDKTAKHHNKTDKKSVEFLLYQTGVFMRYLLVIKQDE